MTSPTAFLLDIKKIDLDFKVGFIILQKMRILFI